MIKIEEEEVKKINELSKARLTTIELAQNLADHLTDRLACIDLARNKFWKDMARKYNLEVGKNYCANTLTNTIEEVGEDFNGPWVKITED